MIGQETYEIERKVAAILKVLSDSAEPLGGRIISRRLREQGIELGERAVRYHLKLMDERGLTCTVGFRDGRLITQPGIEELESSLVCDKIGFAISRIELLSYLTSFDLDSRIGAVPIDVSIFSKEEFDQALDVMKDVFDAGICFSNLIAVASEGERLGELVIPQGKIGFATVCSAMVNGLLLKSGIPNDPRFGGILQIRNYSPSRFVDIIEYGGSTIDPFGVFIAGGMTNVAGVVQRGEGKILASLNEIPLASKSAAESIIKKLKEINFFNLDVVGKPGESVCEIPVRPSNVGLVFSSGLNAVAAAAEKGIEVASRPLNGVLDIGDLHSFGSL